MKKLIIGVIVALSLGACTTDTIDLTSTEKAQVDAAVAQVGAPTAAECAYIADHPDEAARAFDSGAHVGLDKSGEIIEYVLAAYC